jgi:hypothetical protein
VRGDDIGIAFGDKIALDDTCDADNSPRSLAERYSVAAAKSAASAAAVVEARSSSLKSRFGRSKSEGIGSQEIGVSDDEALTTAALDLISTLTGLGITQFGGGVSKHATIGRNSEGGSSKGTSKHEGGKQKVPGRSSPAEGSGGGGGQDPNNFPGDKFSDHFQGWRPKKVEHLLKRLVLKRADQSVDFSSQQGGAQFAVTTCYGIPKRRISCPI